MGNFYAMFVLALVLVHASARNIPTETKPNDTHITEKPSEKTAVPTENTMTVASAAAPSPTGVKDKKCIGAFGGWGAGVGGYAGVMPALGGVGGLGGLGGLGGASGLGGLGGGKGIMGGIGGLGGAGGVGGGVGGVAGKVLP